jgi:23S rRNA pseudouridine2604 synthase
MQDYPVRINKYLAHKGVVTRRGADELIQKKKVFINGVLAKLGDMVQETDHVEVKGGGAAKKYSYYAYYKPLGIITHSPQGDEESIKETIGTDPRMRHVFPIGRLDKDSYGLIILTDDGRVTDRLLNPMYDHEKEYIVKTREPLSSSFAQKMERGVDIEGYVTKPCTVHVKGDTTFSITLGEGKKHQIRRMVAALHNDVIDLKRVRIMNIRLGKLAPGVYRAFTDEERSSFLSSLGIPLP